jgi:1-acyl-sn-glycerol-3-phosphate acyltransferase
LACFQKRGLFYLVRGDVFANKFFARILKTLHMLPVYRKRDRGYGFIKQNYSTFSTCHQTLANNRTVMILAEGTTEHEKRLRPLMKGTARIAFGALEAYPDMEDVYVVPVGVNYTYAERFRSEVYIDFGTPISVRSFEESYRLNANKGINDLTRTLKKNLEPRVIHIEAAADNELVERLFQIDRSRQPFKVLPIVTHNDKPLKREKRIADFVNQFGQEDKQILKEKTNSYFSLLQEFGLNNCIRFEKKGSSFLNGLFLILGFPFFLVGYMFGQPLIWLAHYIARTTINHITFLSSIIMAAGVVLWLIYLILILLVAIWFKAYYLFLIPVLCLFALFYGDVYKDWRCRWVYENLSAEQQQSLLEQQGNIEKILNF